MTTFFITHHPGAIDWASRHGLRVDCLLAHFDPEIIAPGDTVIGILPVNLVARVGERWALLQFVARSAAAGARAGIVGG